MSIFSFLFLVALYFSLFFLEIVFQLTLCVKALRDLFTRRGSLSSIPGPRWAAWTRLWIVKQLSSGRCPEIFCGVNKEYGRIARIGPNNLLTNDPEVVKRILSAPSGYKRGPWYDSLRFDPLSTTLASERDTKIHSHLKHKLATTFAPKNIYAMEAIIDERLEDWLDRARTTWQHEPCDISRRVQFLTVDIITQVCLGTPLGCVADDKDKLQFLKSIETGQWLIQHFSIFTEFNPVAKYLAMTPGLRNFTIPTHNTRDGVGRLLKHVRKTLKEYEAGDASQPSMLGKFLSSGIARKQVDVEILNAVVAGSDTTSTSAQSILLAILSHPDVYRKLKTEIEAAVARGVSYPIKRSEAAELRYLQACIMEGMRVYPPLGLLMEREVPPAGDIIDGHRIPGGTYVGLNMRSIQQDEAIYGDSPEAFRPERWLVDDKLRVRKMTQTHGLIFSYGPTKCLGVPMARMSLSKIVFELFRNFDISIANPYKPWTSICYGIFFQKDFNVYLEPVPNDKIAMAMVS